MFHRKPFSESSFLITGAAGFIGSHLVDLLLERGAREVVGVDNLFLGSRENLAVATKHARFSFYEEDACRPDCMGEILKKHQVETVFNAATKALKYSFIDPEDAFSVNTEIAKSLVYHQRHRRFKTLIHLSSSEVYGTALKVPMDEDHPCAPTTPYAAGKLAADALVLSYARTFDLDTVILRPFNNFGPRQNYQKDFQALIPLTISRISQGLPPVIEGGGNQTRDFIFVFDTIDALLQAYLSPDTRGQCINLGSGIERTIGEVVGLISQEMGCFFPCESKPERTSDVKRHCADVKLAKKLLDFSPRTDFVWALKQTIQWYLQHQKKE